MPRKFKSTGSPDRPSRLRAAMATASPEAVAYFGWMLALLVSILVGG